MVNRPGGTMLEVRNRDGAVQATAAAAVKWSATGCERAYAKPRQEFLIIDVSVKVVAGTGTISALYFEYVNVDGALGLRGTGAGCADIGAGIKMPEGTLRTGVLVYDVDPAKSGTLNWVGPAGEFYGSWAIPAKTG